jgi:hypothetical protein
MSRFDSAFLFSIGIEESNQPIPIPLYTRKRVAQAGHNAAIPNLVVHQVVDVPREVQDNVRLVIQIVDGRKFQRYFGVVHAKIKQKVSVRKVVKVVNTFHLL